VPNNLQAVFAATEEGKKARCSTAAFPKLFTFREVAMQVSLVTMLRPSPRTAAPSPCLPLDIKDLLKEDAGFFDGGLMEDFFDGGWTDWWAACENDAGELC
jgi:hypothetical protein